MSDSDDGEKWFGARVDPELLDAVDFSDTTKQAWLDRKLKQDVYGEDYVAADEKKEDATEQWEQTEAGIGSVLAYLDNIAGDGGAVSIETLREEFEAFREERGEAIAEQFEEPVSEAMEEYEQKQAAKVESLVETIGESLQNGLRVFPAHGKVEKLSKLRGETPEDSIDFLQERYPDVPDAQFREKGESQRWR